MVVIFFGGVPGRPTDIRRRQQHAVRLTWPPIEGHPEEPQIVEFDQLDRAERFAAQYRSRWVLVEIVVADVEERLSPWRPVR